MSSGSAAVAAQDTTKPPSVDETIRVMNRVLAERFGIERPDLNDSTELATLGLDSVAFFEYVFELEGALHLTFADIPRDLATTGDLIRFVQGEVVRQHASSDPE
jgi:acyl carrier protein